MLEMLSRTVDLIREQGAAGTALLPVGAKHEVVDNELAASVEQVRERYRAVGGFKDIVFPDLDPRERPALLRQPVAFAGPRLLLGEQGSACLYPLGFRDDFMLGHGYLRSI